MNVDHLHGCKFLQDGPRHQAGSVSVQAPAQSDVQAVGEEVLEEMRKSDPPVRYLVGSPKGRLSRLESALAKVPWQTAREGVEVKLVKEDGDLYVLAKSEARISKERGMRQRRLKKLWKRLGELQKQKVSYENLLLKIGAARGEAEAKPPVWLTWCCRNRP